MTLADVIRTGSSNLGRRKVRTVLTTVGVWVGILTIVTMVSAGIGLQQQVTATIEQLGLETVFVQPVVQRDDFNLRSARPRVTKPITPATLDQFRTLPGVSRMTVGFTLPDVQSLNVTINGKTGELVIVDQQGNSILFSNPVTVLAGKKLDDRPDEHGLVLGQAYLRRIGITETVAQNALVGQVLTVTVSDPRGTTQSWPIPVLGIVSNERGAYMGVADKVAIAAWYYGAPDILQTDGYSQALLHTNSLNDAGKVSAAITTLGFQANTLQFFLDQINRIFTVIQVALSSIGLLALFIAGIGIANTMIMAIYERTREIGVLKALGASEGDVLRLFLVEAGLIGLIGGVLGVIGGWLLGLILNWGAHYYLESQQLVIPGAFFAVTPELVAAAIIFGTFVGLLAGIYPAARAGRLDPLVALRHE